jgi:predicted transcriptional regulator
MTLNQYLDKKNLSAHDFAKLSKISPKTIYRLLDGHRTNKKSLARRIYEFSEKSVPIEETYSKKALI